MVHPGGGGFLTGRLEQEAETWSDPSEIPEVTPDPKDDYLVALYRECGADALISGDTDLTELTGEIVVLASGHLLAQL